LTLSITSKILCYSICLVAAASLNSSHAGQLEEGEKELIQARRDYFNAIAQGKVKTSDERASLYRSTVGAASGKLNQLVVNRWKEAFEKHSAIQQSRPELAPPAESIQQQLAKISKTDGKTRSSEDSNETGEMTSPTSSAANDSSAGRHLTGTGSRASGSETALDGSKVPRLLEFNGSQGSKKTSPTTR
jgi:hypothetical protein